MNRPAVVATAAALALLSGCASGAGRRDFDTASVGYLEVETSDRMARAVPPPPEPGTPAYLADIEQSERYRVFQDTDRWLLATSHAEVRPPLALQHFDCALGVRLGDAETPTLDRMMARIFHDTDAVAEHVKARAHRARPVGDDPDRRSCQAVTAASRAGASYPSGSAALGTAYGEAFAAVAPERAEAVRRIGLEMGVSRLVCGMHYPSDVAAGEAVGRAVVAELIATPAFQRDLPAARAEIEAARATGRTSPGCAAERLALTPTLTLTPALAAPLS